MEAEHWHKLRNFTHARIAMGRAGNALPSDEVLKFRLSHAIARDAVFSVLHTDLLANQFKNMGLHSIEVQSMAESRNEFLLNPHKGRELNPEYAYNLSLLRNGAYDLCIILGDGLSANAINLHAVSLISNLLGLLNDWHISPIIIARHARVALSDTVGEILNAKTALILIGERPGLSSPHSLGAYITFDPRTGNTDEKRNCISNIHPEGLSYTFAAAKIASILNQVRSLKLSGIKIKDNFNPTVIQQESKRTLL